MRSSPQVVVIGAGIGGLTAAALLAQAGCCVTVLEAQTYPGGCAGTFYHQGYRFDAGATVAGGFHDCGPHSLVGRLLNLHWPVRQHEPAWVVHLPDRQIALTQSNADVLGRFPQSESFWNRQQELADIGWKMSAQGMPWPPGDWHDLLQLGRVGLNHFPKDVRLLPAAFQTVAGWMKRSGLAGDLVFRRFVDAQLLISAQTTSEKVNALWGAAALDLARKGVYHVEGGIGTLADTLVDKIRSLGSDVLFRQQATRIEMASGQAKGVYVHRGKRTTREDFYPADFIVANLTPWSLSDLLADGSPAALRREVGLRAAGWGAFVLHLGIETRKVPADWPDHHQIITDMEGPMGEGRSIFMSLSPVWDRSRAPEGFRAVTVTTHTAVKPWWDAFEQGPSVYDERKAVYSEILLTGIERALPGFRSSIRLLLPGSPLTYQFYTGRHQGMVGGFPITSLFRVRGPRTGIPNVRLVGDSIFPGQSTAGVSLGAIRVAQDAVRHLSFPGRRVYSVSETLRP